MKKSLIKTYDKVKKLLQEKEHLKDNCEAVCANIWIAEFKKLDLPDTSFGFLTAYANNQLTDSETITKAWRESQRLHPELRGEKWESRQKYSRKKFKDELKDLQAIDNPFVGSPIPQNLNGL